MSRCFGATRLTTLPPMLTSPSVISSSPAIIRSKVDLPHPEGPTRTQNSPSAMSMSTPRITCVEPKFLRTALMLTAAILLLRQAVLRRLLLLELLRSWMPCARYDHIIRPAGLDPGHDVLRRLPPQLDFRLLAEKRGVRRQDHLGVAQQPALGRGPLD